MSKSKSKTNNGRGTAPRRADHLLPSDPRMATMITMRDEDAARQVTWDATVERLNSIPGWEDIMGDVVLWRSRYDRAMLRRGETAEGVAFRAAVGAELKRRKWTYERLRDEVDRSGLKVSHATLSRQLGGAQVWTLPLRRAIEAVMGVPFAPAMPEAPEVPEATRQLPLVLPGEGTVSLPDKACVRMREEARLALRAGRGLSVASTVYLFSLLGGRPLELIVREAEAELGAGDPQ